MSEWNRLPGARGLAVTTPQARVLKRAPQMFDVAGALVPEESRLRIAMDRAWDDPEQQRLAQLYYLLLQQNAMPYPGGFRNLLGM